jgi:F0F1-type ATP synthase membrane subunit b/b'
MSLDPLGQISVVTILATVGIFLATFWLLRRTIFVPLIVVMEQRAARIAAARAGKAEGEAALKGAQAAAEQARAAASADAQRAVTQRRDELAERRRVRLGQASADAEAVMVKGREEIAALKQSEEAKLATELSACVNQALEKMIGRTDEAAVRFVVSRVLAAKESA